MERKEECIISSGSENFFIRVLNVYGSLEMSYVLEMQWSLRK